MKKVILSGIFILSSIVLLAQANTDILPSTAKAFIQENFSEATVVKIEENSKWELWENDKYEVNLSTGYELEFDKNGNIMGMESHNNEAIPHSALPTSIASYLQSNYANAKISSWEQKRKKQEVELASDLELEFDKKGNFIKLD